MTRSIWQGYTPIMNGLILAGGQGSRLDPITKGVNKHMLPIFDKPMIYYPLTTLILAGVKRVIVVTNLSSISQFENLLGNGQEFGIEIRVVPQATSDGLPSAIRAGLIGGKVETGVQVILGDNIFHGIGMGRNLKKLESLTNSGIFSISVRNPQDFGVLKFGDNGHVMDIIEKPSSFISNSVIPGMYYFPSGLLKRIELLKKSGRGEYEIVDLLRTYLNDNLLTITELNRGTSWYDGGTVESLNQAANFVKTSQERLGQLVGSPHEAALNQGFITEGELTKLIKEMPPSPYWENLAKVI